MQSGACRTPSCNHDGSARYAAQPRHAEGRTFAAAQVGTRRIPSELGLPRGLLLDYTVTLAPHAGCWRAHSLLQLARQVRNEDCCLEGSTLAHPRSAGLVGRYVAASQAC